jgi:hypothetical protein
VSSSTRLIVLLASLFFGAISAADSILLWLFGRGGALLFGKVASSESVGSFQHS